MESIKKKFKLFSVLEQEDPNPMLSVACIHTTYECGFERVGSRIARDEEGVSVMQMVQCSNSMGLERRGIRTCVSTKKATVSSKGPYN